MNDVPKMKAKLPRAIALDENDTLDTIIRNSTYDGAPPRTLLVWRRDGGWDLYGLPGVTPKVAPNNSPVPPDATLQPSKMQVESVTALRSSPGCYKLNGVWHWT